MWKKPWKYKEGILITVSILFIAFLLEFSTSGAGTENLLIFPNNLYFGGLVVVSLLIMSALSSKLYVIEWLGSVPAAISSISLLLFVSFLMGITKQTDINSSGLIHKFGLSHILTSWPYLFANLFLLLSLGITTIKNIQTFKLSKAGFIISHLGLWIVIFGANFGSSQLQRLEITLNEGEISQTAFNSTNNEAVTLPFAIRLNDFTLEEYPPKLAIISHSTSEVINFSGNSTIEIDTMSGINLGHWKIEVKQYIPLSVKAGNNYYFVNELGAAPSAFVSITDSTGNITQGWISCGSYNRQFESLKLNNNQSLVMLLPEPMLFTSDIEIFQNTSKPITYQLQVNKPIEVDGWKIYQMSYNSQLGIWSDTSTIEIIKDPWLGIVYTGILLMLLGALYMFWVGTKSRKQAK